MLAEFIHSGCIMNLVAAELIVTQKLLFKVYSLDLLLTTTTVANDERY